MTHKHLISTRLGLATAVVAGAVLGSIFGQPGSSRAASTAIPKNTSPPTISGSAGVGQTLTATTGTWSGAPTSFAYTWKRCDTGGASCAAISHATSKAYTVTTEDQGSTLRITVKATNADGSAFATSAQTAVVPPAGCISGTGTIPVTSLAPPAQLVLDRGSVTPSVVTPAANAIDIHFTVTACGGRPVQGASVFATAVPYNQFAATTATSGSDGTVTIHEPKLGGFPVSGRQHLLVVFARATKPGDPLLGGISARRLVSFPARAR